MKKLSLPKPTQLPSGSWRMQLCINGKRLSETFSTEEEALYWAAGLKTQQQEVDQYPKELTVTKAIDRFIEMHDGVFSPATVRGYRGIQKNRIARIQNLKLGDLSDEILQRWVSSLSKQYAPKTVSNAYSLVVEVLKFFRKNYHPNVKLPQKTKEEIKIPTEEELQKIFSAAKGSKYELPILIACWLGMRESEIVGMKWSQIKDGYLTVNNAIVIGENNVSYEKGTKTTSSTRKIRIPKYIQDKLDELPRKDEYVFSMSGHAMYMGFVRLCKKAGVEPYRFHDLRHVNASVMLLNNTPIKHVTKRMGHKTDEMVKRVYGHVFRNRESAYDDTIDEYFDELFSPAE